MVNVVKETNIKKVIKEKFILQLPEEQYENELEDSHLVRKMNNVENFVMKHTGECELSVVDVRYMNNDMKSGIIEIEAEKVIVIDKVIKDY